MTLARAAPLAAILLVIGDASAAVVETGAGVTVFPSIAALRANTQPLATAHVQGYAAPGDGGGGDLESVAAASPGAAITGSISGTTLTVSAVSSGALAVGQVLAGAGIGAPTVILSLGTGKGEAGTYGLNTAWTIPSESVAASADNGCTRVVDAARHVLVRTSIGDGLPVEACGMLVSGSGAANAAALTAAIASGPYRLLLETPGRYALTGVVMSGATPHEFVGSGPNGPSSVACSGIAYNPTAAAEIPGTLLAIGSGKTICFQGGPQVGNGNAFRDMDVAATDTTSVVGVALGDSTTMAMLENFACHDSKIAGYVAMYWGNSNKNVVEDCIFEGGRGRAPAAEMYEHPNVRGLLGGAIQNVIHIAGALQMPQSETGSDILQIDAAGSGAIMGNVYIGTRVNSGATCFTLAGGNNAAQSFDHVGYEDCRRVLVEAPWALSRWNEPNAEGTNGGSVLSGLAPGSTVRFGNSLYTAGTPENLVINGVVHRTYTGTLSPNGTVTALDIGDTYYRMGGRVPAETPCHAAAADNAHWLNAAGGAC